MYLLKRRIIYPLTAILGALILSVPLNAGTDFYAFLEEPVSASITGMGASGTASGMGGFTFYNPAGLALRDKSFISFDFTRINDDLGRGYIESGWVFPTWYLGGSFQTQSTDVNRTDITGILDGAYAPIRGTMLSLLTGIKKERYSLGIALNGVQEVIGDYSSYGFSGSVGLLVNIVPDHITVGLAGIHAAGRHNSFLDQKEKLKSERFPATVRGGVCLKDSLLHKFPTIVTADVVYNDNDEIVTVPVGIDFRILPPLSIRVGKRFNHPADLFSLGLGLQWQNIAFDASFTPYNLKSDHFLKRSVALTYMLPSIRNSDEEHHFSNRKSKVSKKETEASLEVIPQEVKVPEIQKDTVISDTIENKLSNTTTPTDSLSVKDVIDTAADSTDKSSDTQVVQKPDSTISGTPGSTSPGSTNASAQPATAGSTATIPVKTETEKATPDTGSVVKTLPDTMVVPVTQDTVKAP